ncbi:MAG: DUF4328 domain-containing protein [Bacteroidota bacterium]
MTREEQLEFCKRCTFRKMDMKQGLICNLRGQKATFQDECPDYEVDKKIIHDEKKKIEAIRPNKKRAEIAQALIWLVMLLEIISMISSYFQYDLLLALQRDEFVSNQIIDSNDIRESVIAILYMIVYVVSAITFIQWFRRAYYNMNIRTRTVHSDGWAAGSWFVPIISLYRPYQIMKEMCTETSKLIKTKAGNSTNDSTVIIGIWWTLWIISNYVGQYVMRSAFKAETVENFLNSTIGDMIQSSIGIPLAIITVMIIKSYSAKEEMISEIESKIE